MAPPYSARTVELADSILRASGSGLRHFSTEKTLTAIFDAAQKATDIQDALVAALKVAQAEIEKQGTVDREMVQARIVEALKQAGAS